MSAGAAAKAGKTVEEILAARSTTVPARRFGSADEFGAVVAETIEGAGADQAFENAAVEQLRIDAQAEIFKAFERLVARTSTMCSTAASPTPLMAASE